MRTERDRPLPGSIRVSAPSHIQSTESLRRQGRLVIEQTPTLTPAVRRALLTCRWFEIAAWVVAGISAFAFAVVILTPIIAPLVSLGSIFSGGWNDWVDFAGTAWKISVTPALTAVVALAVAVGCRKGTSAVQQRFNDESAHDLRRLEGLMKSH